jgi:deoxyribodipyrimidine photolyase-related protein
MARNREKLETNPRIGMMLKTYDRMEPDKQQAIKVGSALFFQKIEAGDIV